MMNYDFIFALVDIYLNTGFIVLPLIVCQTPSIPAVCLMQIVVVTALAMLLPVSRPDRSAFPVHRGDSRLASVQQESAPSSRWTTCRRFLPPVL